MWAGRGRRIPDRVSMVMGTVRVVGSGLGCRLFSCPVFWVSANDGGSGHLVWDAQSTNNMVGHTGNGLQPCKKNTVQFVFCFFVFFVLSLFLF